MNNPRSPGDYPEADKDEPISSKIARKVNKIVTQSSGLERFRNKCKEMAIAQREYLEKKQLYHFQVVSNCMAVSDVSGLKLKAPPEAETAEQIIRYIQDFFLEFARVHIQHSESSFVCQDDIFGNKDLTWESLLQRQDEPKVKQSLRIGHLEQCFDWLKSI